MASRQQAGSTVSRPQAGGGVPYRATAPKARHRQADGAAERRYLMIEQAAYFRAAQRGFEPGHELDDWLAAEAEVERLAVSKVRPAGRAAQGRE